VRKLQDKKTRLLVEKLETEKVLEVVQVLKQELDVARRAGNQEAWSSLKYSVEFIQGLLKERADRERNLRPVELKKKEKTRSLWWRDDVPAWAWRGSNTGRRVAPSPGSDELWDGTP
jgi:hypothetical protein